jgi:hypothetical protein
MEENERLNPGIHKRLFEHLIKEYPGESVDADTFLWARVAEPQPVTRQFVPVFRKD